MVIGLATGALRFVAATRTRRRPRVRGRRAPPPPPQRCPLTPGLAEERFGRPTAVPGQANIFGAGRAEPPQPGGGGAGKPPPGWQLSNAAGGALTVPSGRTREPHRRRRRGQRRLRRRPRPDRRQLAFRGSRGSSTAATACSSSASFSPTIRRPARRPDGSTSPRATGPNCSRPVSGRPSTWETARRGPSASLWSDAPVPRVRRRLPVPGRPGLVRQQRRQAHRYGQDARPRTSIAVPDGIAVPNGVLARS